MTATPSTIDELLDYWPGNIPFKGRLVSDDGTCMCAQGQALHFLKGLTVNELRGLNQSTADTLVAELFGISLAHSILLRIVNDRQKGAPSSVIRNPEQILGDQTKLFLAFWRHLDCMSPKDWIATEVAIFATSTRDWGAAIEKVDNATAALAWRRTSDATTAAANTIGSKLEIRRYLTLGLAAAKACDEIQGAAYMRANNHPFFFLPLFGFSDPEAVTAIPT